LSRLLLDCSGGPLKPDFGLSGDVRVDVRGDVHHTGRARVVRASGGPGVGQFSPVRNWRSGTGRDRAGMDGANTRTRGENTLSSGGTAEQPGRSVRCFYMPLCFFCSVKHLPGLFCKGCSRFVPCPTQAKPGLSGPRVHCLTGYSGKLSAASSPCRSGSSGSARCRSSPVRSSRGRRRCGSMERAPPGPAGLVP